MNGWMPEEPPTQDEGDVISDVHLSLPLVCTGGGGGGGEDCGKNESTTLVAPFFHGR